MPIQDLENIFGFLGGLGMFLYGMNIMADGLQKSAGNKMKHFLGLLTNNRFIGVAIGALVTAIIQSSGATTVMVVGFVNAGVLNLSQAVGVIMGANIGTTITAWIVSMSQLGDAFKVMNPSFIAPLIIGIGAIVILFARKEKVKDGGEIAIGIGLLFLGLKFMSGSIEPYTDNPIFSQAFALLGRNPILGMLVGAFVTALLQSSSASVGILQTLALNGVVTANAAIYITLGQNIGSCVTALISAAGASKAAKKAAVIHLSFNVLGACIFGIGMGTLFMINKQLATSTITSVQISIFHTFFNITNTALLFPFADKLVRLSDLIIRGDEEKPEAAEPDEFHLDERIFETPSFAIEAALLEIVNMGHTTLRNVENAVESIYSKDSAKIQMVFDTEKKINKMQRQLTDYLVKINNLSLNEEQKRLVNNFFYTISDIERIGDHAENIAEQADYMKQLQLDFSEPGKEDLRQMAAEVLKSVAAAITARETENMDAVRKVSQYEDLVDSLEEEVKDKHIERLSRNECQSSAGIAFLDIVSNLERMSDHAYNIAGYVKDEM